MKSLGVVVPLVTPCSRLGEIDKDGLVSVCNYMTDAGCASIFVAGSTGRGAWFGRDDRARICRTVADCIGPETLLLAGCMATGLSDMLENANAMADSGANVAVITSPGYFVYSAAEVESILLKFADNSPLPVVVYDIPVFAGVKLDTGAIMRLANHGNVAGLKDSSADLERFQGLLRSLESVPDFYLLQGKEHLLADSILAGASGLVVSLLHVDPRPFVSLYHAAACKQVEDAR